jgi:DNA mismatch repair protein MLH3
VPSLVINDSQEDQGNIRTQKIEATALADARVLRQVDNKFILALLPPLPASGISSLILVDQHAADERIKVDAFYKQLCTDGPVSLSRPINFEVSDEEATRLREAQAYFASWAVEYHIKHMTAQRRPPHQQALISVTHLAGLIAERCRLEPRILIEMLRKEIWSNEPHRPCTSSERDITTWISPLAHCPEGLLDMVNSRACRSAIMFNDVLTISQCQELLRRLSQCSLPFQCAHGRPSMTVLTSFGKKDGFGFDAEEESFGKQFRRWHVT